MVGGDKKVFDDALPVLQSFSANVIHMGELGTGTVAAGQQHDGVLQRRRCGRGFDARRDRRPSIRRS